MPNLSKSFIDKITLPDAGQDFYRDANLKGFGLRVSAGGSKSFIVETRVNGRVKRITLGKYGALTPEQARKRAQIMLGEIASGKDPRAEKLRQNAQNITLNEAFEDYLLTRKDLKAGTLLNYRQCLNAYVDDWKAKRLVDITKDMVQKRHQEIGQRSPSKANNTMRVVRAIFNHSINKFEDAQGKPIITVNPVERLSQNRAWYNIERKQTLLKSHELKPWYEATLQLNQEVTRDYLHFLLFTGLRKMEAASLKWPDIDFKERTITVRDTKNKQPHILPITDFLHELLKSRQAAAFNQWVFPSPVSENQLKTTTKAVKRVSELSGIEFTCHDLRRTFITIAESLDIPAYALKRLLNHKDQADVTAGYIVSNVERLREPMNKIHNYMLALIAGDK